MITITRRQARRLRGIFRRSVLGIGHRGTIPPLMLHAEGTQLRAQYRYAPVLAVEHVGPGRGTPRRRSPCRSTPWPSSADRAAGRGPAAAPQAGPANVRHDRRTLAAPAP
jgi:hypothetical protein